MRALGLLASVLVLGCLEMAVSRAEVARVRSPSERLEALVIETNGGTPTSFGYDVYVVPLGGRPQSGERGVTLYAATRSDSAYGLNVDWPDSATLRVSYLAAQDTQRQRDNVTVAGEAVHVLMLAGIRDSTARGGGMLHNLQAGRGQ